MRQTMSVLAGQSGTDRWVMTAALLLVGSCQIATGAGLTAVRMLARVLLILTGLSTLGIAATPEPAAGPTSHHLAFAVSCVVTTAVWPVLVARRAPAQPWIVSVHGCATVTVIFAGLSCWLLIAAHDGGGSLGMVERLTSAVQGLFPLVVALALRQTAPDAGTRDSDAKSVLGTGKQLCRSVPAVSPRWLRQPDPRDQARWLEMDPHRDRVAGEGDRHGGQDVAGQLSAADQDLRCESEVPYAAAPGLVQLPSGYLGLELWRHARVDVRGPPVQHQLDDLAGAFVPFRSRRLRPDRPRVIAVQGEPPRPVEWRRVERAATRKDRDRPAETRVNENGRGKSAGPAVMGAGAVGKHEPRQGLPLTVVSR
jgi:hypothetical protein